MMIFALRATEVKLIPPLFSCPRRVASVLSRSIPEPLELIVRMQKVRFKVGEPIIFGIEIRNNSITRVFLRDVIMLSNNAFLHIRTKGENVGFTGDDIAQVGPPIRSRDDFVGLWRGSFFGQTEVTAGTVSLKRPGNYSLVVTYRGVNKDLLPKDLGIEPWTGTIESVPIAIEVK